MDNKPNNSYQEKESSRKSNEREEEKESSQRQGSKNERSRENERYRNNSSLSRENQNRDSNHHQSFSRQRQRSMSRSNSPRRDSRYHRPYYSSRDRPRNFRPREGYYNRGDKSPRIKYHRKTSRENSSENKGNVLYISNLPIKVSESQIKEKFSKFGKIEEINIVREPFSKVSRGFAFVTYEDPKSGQEAIKALDKTTMDDKTINVEESKRARPHKPTPGVYLGPKSNEYNRRRMDKRDFNYHGKRSRSDRNRSFSRRSHRNSRSKSRNRRNSRSRSREIRNSRSRSREMMNRNTGRRYY